MNEIELVLACQKGEKQAFNDIIIRYYPYVSKFLLKITADETVSEDLTQDTFLKLIRSIDRFDVYGKATFATYLMAIAKNCYIDYLRKNKNIILSIDDQEVADVWTVENKVLKEIEASEIIKAIDTLPWEQAQAIKLKYLEQLTLQEVAERFNTHPKTIKSRIHAGMVKLRKSFLKRGNENG
ncbi:MAG: RNA polymerase sigma factor [Caulobacteraceae bacterium]